MTLNTKQSKPTVLTWTPRQFFNLFNFHFSKCLKKINLNTSAYKINSNNYQSIPLLPSSNTTLRHLQRKPILDWKYSYTNNTLFQKTAHVNAAVHFTSLKDIISVNITKWWITFHYVMNYVSMMWTTVNVNLISFGWSEFHQVESE